MTRLLAAALTIIVIGTPQQTDRGVASSTGLVVSASSIASDAGAAVLADGGNAVDAAVATAFALAVTLPAAGNLGGGGFMVVRTPDGKATTFDYREKAPGRATPTMYLGADGRIDRSLTSAGYLAPGVPGTVRGLALAHSRFGRLPWKRLVEPAAALARDGFEMHPTLARGLNAQLEGVMGQFPTSVAAYGKPGGGRWEGGDRIVLADLGRTLQAIADGGPDAFYTGWIAEALARDMAANGGLISVEDLAKYEAKERAPVRGTFNGYEIISMPPPSSGGIALVEMLNILETLGIQKLAPGSVEATHLQIEAMRRAFLDRARFLGDPDFTDIPVERLTSKAHAREAAASIARNKASNSADLGKDIVTAPSGQEPMETTHFSVLDRDGLAVSQTYTLEGSYGSRVVVKGLGFLLNNEMGDFNKKPGETNLTGDIGTPANLIAPGKRMLSSMTPAIVTRDGKLALITGTPGGRTIINTVMNVILNVTAFGMTGREAVDAKRLHHQWLPDRASLEAGALSDDALARLRAMGHEVRQGGSQGDAHSIWIDPKTGTAYGINDRRTAASKASVPGK
ncbi:MAG TPA: gamma-glutamyltransferase [Vicinamibacterales bacterium]|nr:gamma-glutamyltransferase [Vicinamibacterales bacterium]